MTATSIRTAFSPETFAAMGHAVVDMLARHLEAAQRGTSGSVMPAGSPRAQCAAFPSEFPQDGDDALLSHIARALDASTQLQSPRFLGHQVATPLPAAALCDLVAAMVNNGMAVFEMGPAASAMERAVLAFLAGCIDFPTSSGGVLTSGGSLGNLTALLAARQAKAPVDVWRRGLRAAPQLCVLVADTAHYSVARALRILGLGDDGVVPVETDAQLRMRPDALEAAVAASRARKRHPFAVVASAGSTAAGAFDPLDAIADVCERHGLWFHVDGAHGASLALSPRHRHKLMGVARADSIVWDAHKLMMMPALVTAVLFRDGAAGAAAFAQDASYLFDGNVDGDDAWSDIGKRTVECTKRMMSLKVYACLRTYGTKAFAEHIDTCCALAATLAARARDLGFEVLTEPDCNIVCFRPHGLDGGMVAAIRRTLLHEGQFYVVQVHRPAGPQGGLWLRSTLGHPLTCAADIDAMLARVAELATQYRTPLAGR